MTDLNVLGPAVPIRRKLSCGPKGLRFSEKDVYHAMQRLGLTGLGGRESAVSILREWDVGNGDVDDVIDWYEDSPTY